MKRTAGLALLLVAFPLLTAMGGKGSGFERAPRVEKNYAVTVTDLSGIAISGEKFSWEGRVFFSGSMGMASVNLPFDRIREITFGEKAEKKVRAVVKLKDGGETRLDIDADSRCFGEAPFGSFMLTVDEIKSVSFKAQQ